MKKIHITAQRLLEDSMELALRIAESGFRPDLLVGIWRGGTPVAIAVQEVLEYVGIRGDHFAIRTSSYAGIGERTSVEVLGLAHLKDRLDAAQSLLLVDDVYDTGLSIEQVIRDLERLLGDRMPALRVATPYYKPENNRTGRAPDYFLHTTADWLVFPHELVGLSDAELMEEKPGVEAVKRRLLELRAAD